ncbi:MAG: hypothetical protein NTX27_02245 [Verrucomicrobia bacterium]|nr:hypothetical protein [Verrucomicrobiota bacterium]
MDVDGRGWTWMDVDGRGWTWMDVDGAGRGRVEGVVVGSGRCRISLRDAGVMRGYTGGVVALLLNHRL